MIGGMGSAGFLALHDGGMNAISGLALNFTRLNGAYYNTTEPVQQPESFVSVRSFAARMSSHRRKKSRCRASSSTPSIRN